MCEVQLVDGNCPFFKMDFARKQLEKYGWSHGKGLGKNENGISEALKPKLKRSVTGVGHDGAADFTEHWWEELYNKAAGNVEVEESSDKRKKFKTKDSNFEITNSTWRLKRKKKENGTEETYSDIFVKKATLTNGGSKTDDVNKSESEEEVESRNVFKMTDEELFAACGGRTAHKGARHGLKALGKLARIEEQERLLLNDTKYEGYSHVKKLKSKECSDQLQVIEDMSLNSDVEIVNNKKKKKKKKHCKDINQSHVINHTGNLETDKSNSNDNSAVKKKKKSKKETALHNDSDVNTISNKRGACEEDEIITETSHEVIKKKKKKCKKNVE